MGCDGHLAFNEPGSSLASTTRVKTLCYDTKVQNSIYFSSTENLPSNVITCGIKTITEANEVIMLVTGVKKSYALFKCVEEGVNHMWTASILQMHKKAIIICDEDSTMELKVKTVKYFKDLQKNVDIYGNMLFNHIRNNINVNDNIMIISPHPDDDVIGMGGTMQLLPNKNNISIV